MGRITMPFLVLFVTTLTVQSIDFASYTKTEIHDGLCADKPIDTRRFRRKLLCGKFCTEDSDCRRFSFCSSSSECMIHTDGTDCVMSGDSTDCSCYKKNMGYVSNTLTCPYGFYGNNCQQVVSDCKEAFSKLSTRNPKSFARPFVKPDPTSAPFQVYCHLLHGGGTILMERTFYCNHLIFNRTMDEYAHSFGFGKETTWIGFDNLVSLQTLGNFNYIQMLLFTADWKMCSAYFFNFKIQDKSSNYTVSYSFKSHEGCSNSLLASSHLSGSPFSTNDYDQTGRNCAAMFGGGLWFDPQIDCRKIVMTDTMDGLASSNSWLDKQGTERIIKMSLLVY